LSLFISLYLTNCCYDLDHKYSTTPVEKIIVVCTFDSLSGRILNVNHGTTERAFDLKAFSIIRMTERGRLFVETTSTEP